MKAELRAARPLSIAARPDPVALERWLRAEAAGPSGDVWSWRSTDGTGYPYPEAAGLWLGCLGPDDAVASWLCRQAGPHGGIGRAGVEYLFDTAIALGGLIEHAARGGAVDAAALERLFEHVVASVEERRPHVGRGVARRWSTEWTPHLLKAAIAVDRHGRRTGDPRSAPIVQRLLADFLPWMDDGWFPLSRGGVDAYVHASCYAVEGLVYLDAVGCTDARSTLLACADGLADAQLPDGGLPAFRAGSTVRSDATAQAVRIWSAVDRHRFSTRIDGALAALASLQAPSGAMLYEPGSGHENTWASLFTLQALRWVEEGPAPACLV